MRFRLAKCAISLLAAISGTVGILHNAGGQAAPAADRSLCAMSTADSSWIKGAIADWRAAERDALKLPESPLPTIVTVDAECTYVANPRSDGGLVWKGSPHTDKISLPDGSVVPFGVISFASPLSTGSQTGFFVMSLPSVWQAKGITSGLGLEVLMDGVLIHEMSHTRQFYFANPRLAELTAKYHLGDDVGDDSLQDAFEKNPAYVADYQAETDLLYAAAAAPSDKEAKELAAEALAHLRTRRAKWFVGPNEKWTPLDEVFLTMEGLGQWTFYAWVTGKDGPGVAPAKALDEVRRKRNRWTQDEGLALFLVVDRLVPGWQKLAFAPQPELAEALLERAAK